MTFSGKLASLSTKAMQLSGKERAHCANWSGMEPVAPIDTVTSFLTENEVCDKYAKPASIAHLTFLLVFDR